MIEGHCQVYPNWLGKMTGDENRGPERTGFVDETQAMIDKELAGHFAAVTHEEHGTARFYIFTCTPESSLFPNVPMWAGPYTANSEEIVTVERNEEPELEGNNIHDTQGVEK